MQWFTSVGRGLGNAISFHRTPRAPREVGFRKLAGYVALALAAGIVFGASAQASTIYWVGGTGIPWSTAANWSTDPVLATPPPTAAPGSADDAVFNISSANANETVQLSASQLVNSLTFNTTWTVSIIGSGGNRNLTLGSGGITLNAGAGAVTIGTSSPNINVFPLVGVSQTWTNNSGSTLNIRNHAEGPATGTDPVTLTLNCAGTGDISNSGAFEDGAAGAPVALVIASTGSGKVFAASSSYSGGTTVKSGIYSQSGNFGTGPILLGDTTGTANATITISGNTTIPNNITVQAGSSGNTLTLTTGTNTPTLTGTLTLNNNLTVNASTGLITISGAISGSGNISTISGTLVLSGANTYTGATSISGGTLSVKSLNSVNSGTPLLASSSLGAPTSIANGTISIGSSAAAGTLLYTGAGETTDRVIDLAGTTFGATIEAAGSGALVFSSNFTTTGAGNKTLTLQGFNSGNNTLQGAIVNGPTGTVGVTKTGPGVWVLSGANLYTGNTSLSGNTVTLDYAAQNNSKIAGVLTLGGVNLNLSGGSTAQAVTSTTLAAGASSINQTNSGTSTIALGAVTRSAGGTLNLPVAGIATTSTINTNNILGGWATVGGADWAVSGASGTNPITALASGGYTALDTTAGTDIANSLQTDSTGLSGARTTNSLKITDATAAQSLALGANNLKLTSGGLLYVGGNGYTISGTSGVLSSGTASPSDLIVQQYGSGDLTISAVIGNGSGASTLTKRGTGTLLLSGANTYTGQTYVTQGVLSINTNSALGLLTTGAQLNLNGGTLQVTAGSGTFALDNAGGNKRNVALGANGGTISVLGTDSLTVSGVVSGAAGSTGGLIKTGDGTLTLAGSNSFTGGFTIKAGTVSATTSANALGGATGAVKLGDTSGSADVTLLGDAHTFANRITLQAGSSSNTITIGNSGDNAAVFSAAVDMGHNLTLTGSGAGSVTLSGAVAGTGNIVANSTGSAGITLSGASVNVTGSITNSGAGSGATTISGVIGSTVTGIVQNSGNSSLALSGANTSYANGIAIKAGTVKVSAVSGLGADTSTVLLGDNTVGANAELTGYAGGFNSNGSQKWANPITVVEGSGTRTLGSYGTNGNSGASFTGAITLNHDLTLNNASVTALELSGPISGTGSGFTITNVGTTGAFETNISGVIGTGVNIVNDTTLELKLSGTTNTNFTGTLTVKQGTVTASTGSACADTTVYINAGAAVKYSHTAGWTIGGLNDGTGGGGVISDTTSGNLRTLTLGGSGVYSFSGSLGSASVLNMTLVKSGSGTQTLGGANLYSGSTTVSNGQLVFSGSNSSSAITTVSGGRLALTNTATSTASFANTAITVNAASGSAATFAATLGASPLSTSITAGNMLTAAKGASLTLAAGNSSTSTLGGAFTMADNAIGTFNLVQESTFSGAGLTIGSATSGTYVKPTLTFDIGGASLTDIDLLTVTKAAAIGTGGGIINFAPLSTTTSLTPGDYTFITASGGLGGNLTLGTPELVVNGQTYTLSLTHSTTMAEILTVTGSASHLSTWTATAGGNWGDPNWNNGVPYAVGDTATFANYVTTSPATVYLKDNRTVSELNFTSTGTRQYTIANEGAESFALTLNKTGSPASITASGDNKHTISAPVHAASDLNVTVSGNAGLDISGGIDNPSGKTLAISQGGTGTLDVGNVANAGIMTVSGTVGAGTIGGIGNTSVYGSLTADSIVQNTLSIAAGGVVTIRETTGGSVSSVPEPGTWVLIGTALLGLLAFRRRLRG